MGITSFAPVRHFFNEPDATIAQPQAVVKRESAVRSHTEPQMVTDQHKQDYQQHGYVVVHGLFSEEGVARIPAISLAWIPRATIRSSAIRA
jgi:hypothetical protein